MSKASSAPVDSNHSPVKTMIMVDWKLSAKFVASALSIPFNPIIRHVVLKRFSFGTLEARFSGGVQENLYFIVNNTSLSMNEFLEWYHSFMKDNDIPDLTEEGKSRITIYSSSPKLVKQYIREKYGLVRCGKTLKKAERAVETKVMAKNIEDDFENEEFLCEEEVESKPKKVKKVKAKKSDDEESSPKKAKKEKKEKKAKPLAEEDSESNTSKGKKMKKEATAKPSKVEDEMTKEQAIKVLVKKVRAFIKEENPVARIDAVTIAKFLKKDSIKNSFMNEFTRVLSEAKFFVLTLKDEDNVTLIIFAKSQPKKITGAFLKAE